MALPAFFACMVLVQYHAARLVLPEMVMFEPSIDTLLRTYGEQELNPKSV
jgi:hypothetical protein